MPNGGAPAPFLEEPDSYDHVAFSAPRSLTHRRVLLLHRHRLLIILGLHLLLLRSFCRSPGASGPVSAVLHRAFALDALIAHFHGLSSALVVGLSSVTLCCTTFLLMQLPSTVAVAWAPSLMSWLLVLYCSFECQWGVACGLWVALVTASASMKSASFIQQVNALRKCKDQHGEGARGAAERKLLPVPLSVDRWLLFMWAAPSLVCSFSALNGMTRKLVSLKGAVKESLFAGSLYLLGHVIIIHHLAPLLRDIAGVAGAEDGIISGDPVALPWLLKVVAVSFITHYLLFTGFYASFHSCFMALAHLTGYPERRFYGPFWLSDDDPGQYFRWWSMPVHEWIKETVYKPLTQPSFHAKYPKDDAKDGTAEETDRRFAVVSGLWPSAAMALGFLVSALLHEIVILVAFRRCWPICSFNLLSAPVAIIVWDKMFPLRHRDGLEKGNMLTTPAKQNGDGSGNGAVVNGAGGRESTRVEHTNKGRHRALSAAVLYRILACQGEIAWSFAVWGMWRKTFLLEP